MDAAFFCASVKAALMIISLMPLKTIMKITGTQLAKIAC